MANLRIGTKLYNKLTHSFFLLNQLYGFFSANRKAPTRIGETRESCIDLVITYHDLTNGNTYVLPFDITNHYMFSHVTSLVLKPDKKKTPFDWRRNLGKTLDDDTVDKIDWNSNDIVYLVDSTTKQSNVNRFLPTKKHNAKAKFLQNPRFKSAI